MSAEYGRDTLYGGDGNDNLQAGAGDDLAYGGTGNDSVNGEDGNDQLFGGDGDDHIYGGAGKDVLHGDAGADVLEGQAGADMLYGGAGADWFVFKGAGALDGGDTIGDFRHGQDKIVLEKLGVKKMGTGAGTVSASDMANGNVLLSVTTSLNQHFNITVADPNGTLTAASFTAKDFLFT